MKFLIQIGNNPEMPIEHDFTFTLMKAIEYWRWRRKTEPIGYLFTTYDYFITDGVERKDINYKDYCPIGSVEFVLKFYELVWGIHNIKPINVPISLLSYAGRNIFNSTAGPDNIPWVGERYIKSHDIIKDSLSGVCDFEEYQKITKGDFQISDIVDVDVEYRCFVLNNELLGVHYYSGDFTILPDLDKIEEIIHVYKANGLPPSAYTLDIYSGDFGDTFHIMEIHDFFSCGLYGFANLDKLPIMFWRSHLDKIKNIKL